MPTLLQRVTSLRRRAQANAPAASYWLRRFLDDGGPRLGRARDGCRAGAERARGVGTAGATEALAPAMLKPRGREYLFAPAVFSHMFACCSLNFHSLSLCCLPTIKTSHSVGTTGRILRVPYPTHKACLCHKQDDKLSRVL